MSQTFFKQNSALGEDRFKDIKPNKILEKLVIGLGTLKTVKPLILSFMTFTRLKDLRI